MAKDIKKDLAAARLDAENRMRAVDFQVDTLSHKTGTNGYFTQHARSITLNYDENNDDFNLWSKRGITLQHEQKHRDNYNQGMYEYALSPEQAYKIEMHDEISANMAGLLEVREEYLQTGDMSVFDKKGRERYGYYADAVKKGEINPFSNKKEDFDKEMALIANGTRDMWMRDFANIYVDYGVNDAKYYGEKDGKHAAYYDQNYERARKIAYTIGGVDFTQYMDKDVEIPEAGKRRIMGGEKLAEELGLPKYDGKMSLLQYQNLLQHALAMRDRNAGLRCTDAMPFGEGTRGQWNTEMAAFAYLTDKTLTSYQQEDYQAALDNVAKNDKALIDGLVNQAARDYAERGEKLPAGDDKAYNKAVDELYRGNVKFNQADLKFEGEVNLRQAFNPKDELPLKELPKEAAELQQKVEDMGWWKRGCMQYAHFFGESWNDEKISKWPAVVRYPAEALGVYVGVPVVSGIKKCGEWGSDAVDAVKGWFGNDADRNKGENKPVRPVDKDKKPEYREWSPKERVSDVQKKQVLNLMADVIRKPDGRGEPDGLMAKKGKQAGQTGAGQGSVLSGAGQKQAGRDALKGDMRKAAQDKARMMQVIEGMNRINGARNAMDAGGTASTLYDKFGDNAYDLLEKAVNEPFNFAQSVGDASIKTSRAAVQALCNADEAQKNAMVQAVLQGRER